MSDRRGVEDGRARSFAPRRFLCGGSRSFAGAVVGVSAETPVAAGDVFGGVAEWLKAAPC